jgi:hypothetical protein
MRLRSNYLDRRWMMATFVAAVLLGADLVMRRTSMRARSIAAVAAVVVLVLTYLAGYWPESRARTSAEELVRVLEQRLASAQAHVRTGELLGQTLTLKEVAAQRNYGQAQELSSTFFDAVRTEAARITETDLRTALNDVLVRRDAVTAALARSDPAVTEILHDIELRFRRALKFALPPAATPAL